MGHLELAGFRVNSQIIMEHGLESKLFEKFSRVFSGHYHTRSNDGRVFYLGNPYEIYWSDWNDSRGFTIFDTETLDHHHIDNPYNMFEIINYDEDTTKLDSDYENNIVKVVIKNKKNQLKYEKFLDKLYSQNPAEVKIVENFEVNIKDFEEDIESEDTISILDRYIQESETNKDKTRIMSIMREVHKESCEMV